jgi:circadian clock protein KaiC
LSDDLIVQRYVEMEGEIRKVMAVVKMRGSNHSKELRLYDVTKDGLVVGAALHDYRGIINGVAQRYQRTEAGTD